MKKVVFCGKESAWLVPDELPLPGTTFNVYTVDEEEFTENTPDKFDMILYPVDMALGTGGKNDHLSKEAVGMMAEWALKKLLVACIKVVRWCIVELVRRKVRRAKK